MLDDMIQIKLAVEGMKAEIIKCFDVTRISTAIRRATEKAVDDFDMKKYVDNTIESVFDQAREVATERLAEKYGGRWAESIEALVDEKIAQVFRP